MSRLFVGRLVWSSAGSRREVHDTNSIPREVILEQHVQGGAIVMACIHCPHISSKKKYTK